MQTLTEKHGRKSACEGKHAWRARRRPQRGLTRLFALTAAFFSFAGCTDRYERERAFLQQPPSAQQVEFVKLAPEQQVRVYVAAAISEPANLTFCDALRKNEKQVLPEVLQLLANERGDRSFDGEKRALIGALTCIRDPRRGCDPRIAPIALTAARSIFDKDTRDRAVEEAQSLRCR